MTNKLTPKFTLNVEINSNELTVDVNADGTIEYDELIEILRNIASSASIAAENLEAGEGLKVYEEFDLRTNCCICNRQLWNLRENEFSNLTRNDVIWGSDVRDDVELSFCIECGTAHFS